MDKDEIKNETVTEETPVEVVDKAEEYLNNWKRERADFLNYKKEEVKRVEEFVKFANEDLILEAVEVLDDLELAVKELPNVGLEQIVKKFNDLFKKYGVERIDVAGKFDPNLHEAMLGEGSIGQTKSVADNEISVEIEQGEGKMTEVRAGYTMHGKVIRPARVKIIKN